MYLSKKLSFEQNELVSKLKGFYEQKRMCQITISFLEKRFGKDSDIVADFKKDQSDEIFARYELTEKEYEESGAKKIIDDDFRESEMNW